MFVQIEFDKNYNIKEMDKIQSTYWNQETVAFHPSVIYSELLKIYNGTGILKRYSAGRIKCPNDKLICSLNDKLYYVSTYKQSNILSWCNGYWTAFMPA